MVIIVHLMQPMKIGVVVGAGCRGCYTEQEHIDMQSWYVHSKWTISPLPNGMRTINVGKKVCDEFSII